MNKGGEIMGSDSEKSCYNCEHYTDTIGENGYCKLYRHNTDSPDVVCLKYSLKSSSPTDLIPINKNLNIKEKFRQPLNKGLYISSILGCVIFSVILVLFGIVIAFTVSSIESVGVSTKVIFIVSALVFILSVTAMLYMLVLRYFSMRFLVSVSALVFLIFMLVFYDTAWAVFNDFVLQLILVVFKQP